MYEINQPSVAVPKSVKQKGERELEIIWSDGAISLLDVVMLRKRCPCAGCIDEWTGIPLVKSEQIDDDIRPERVQSVGNYALSIAFSDGHKTGIYTYKYLKQL